MSMRDPAAKSALFDAYARIGKALSSGRRLEMLDVLANGERHVEALAGELGMSVANASRHLQILRSAGIITARRERTLVHYRLATPDVVGLIGSLRRLAQSRLDEIGRLARAYLGDRDDLEPVTRAELARRLRDDEELVVLDVRPVEEFMAGHVPGAVSMPVRQLRRRLRELPPDRRIVAYCRGPLCAFAHEAIEVLRAKGFDARRLEDGLPEWAAAGLPVEAGEEGRRRG